MGKGLLLNIFRCRIEGQYFLITCIAGLAEGVNLVTKTVFLNGLLIFGFNSNDLSRNLTLLV